MELSGYGKQKCGGEPSDVTVKVNGGLEFKLGSSELGGFPVGPPCGGAAVRLPSVLRYREHQVARARPHSGFFIEGVERTQSFPAFLCKLPVVVGLTQYKTYT